MISGLRRSRVWVVVSLGSLLSLLIFLKSGIRFKYWIPPWSYRVHVSLNIYQLKQRINSGSAGRGTDTGWVGINLTTAAQVGRFNNVWIFHFCNCNPVLLILINQNSFDHNKPSVVSLKQLRIFCWFPIFVWIRQENPPGQPQHMQQKKIRDGQKFLPSEHFLVVKLFQNIQNIVLIDLWSP